MLHVQCPNCHANLRAQPKGPGSRITCPRCKQKFAVAVPRETEEAPEPSGGGSGILVFILLLLVLLAAGGGIGWMAWTGQGPFARSPATGTEVAMGGPKTPPITVPPSSSDVSAVKPRTTKPTDPPSSKPVRVVGDPPHRGPDGDPDPVKPTVPDDSPGQRYALLVGVQKYEAKELPNLKYTEADVEELAEVLQASGYPKGNVALLTEKKGREDARALPTAEHIRAALDVLLKKCHKNDLLLVAFAGHGIERKESRRYYFCPLQANLAEPATLVSLNEVYDKLKNCDAGYKLLLADACRNDPETRGVREVPEEANVPSVTRPQFAPPPGGVMAFYSCSPSQYAYEPADLKHGVFFHFLIEGLRGQADLDGDGEIIREELEAYVKKHVRNYVVENLKREQWPHLLGESNDQRPLVTLPRSATPVADPRPKIARKELAARSRVLLEETFQNVTEGKVPAKWKGRDLYGVLKDKQGRLCLQPTCKLGVIPPITLPDTPISGDFYLEVEFNLGNFSDSHTLTMILEGLGHSVPLRIERDGKVYLGDRPVKQALKFTQGVINRLRLIREGRIYRVSVNDSVVFATPLTYSAGFDRAHLVVPGGHHFGEETAQIYAVRIGLLPSLGEDRDVVDTTRTGRVLLEEDFTGVTPGAAPKGWDGKDIMIVQKGDSDRAILEANATKDRHFIQLPSLPIRGDFFVECEFDLANYHDSHNLQINLAGDVVLPLLLDRDGTVTLADKPPKADEHWVAGQPHRLRLLREGAIYHVSIDDLPVLTMPLPRPYQGEFRKVEFGLTAGHHFGTFGARLFSIRIGLLDPSKGVSVVPEKPGPEKPKDPAAAGGIKENFTSIKEGALPEGWTAAAPTIGVKKEDDRAALVITDPSKGEGMVALPVVDLKGDFELECNFAIPDKETKLAILLQGKPRQSLTLEILGDGKVALEGRPTDASEAMAKPGETNRLQLERTEKAYIVTLNARRIGQLPVTAAPGVFETVKFGLGLKAESNTSPKVFSIRVKPAADGKP
jgi:hypothetical protein